MATSYPQAVLLGDSLFQMSVVVREGFSFHSALQSHCLRRLDVVNRGYNGWNSKNVLQFLPDMIPPPKEGSPKIKYLVLLIGANDAMLPISGVYQNIPLDEYRANVRAIITHPNVVAHGATVLLVTPPPVDELSRIAVDIGERGLPEIARHAVRTAEYAQAVRELAAEVPGTVLVDLWRALHDRAIELTPGWGREEAIKENSKEGEKKDKPWLGTLESGTSGGFKDLFWDGLHMNGNGYRVFYELLVQHILPGADLTDWRTWVYPGWMELNARG